MSRAPVPALLLLLLLLAAAVHARAQSIAGCPVFPPDNIWNTPVDTLPVHFQSADWVRSIGAGLPLHADFGAGSYRGLSVGIPWNIVPPFATRFTVPFEQWRQSDPGPYPIPSGVAIEGGPQSEGDRHVLLIDPATCKLYEMLAVYPTAAGGWRANCGAVFDLRSNALRPDDRTSADAAGLPILPGLVRWDEVAAGEIRHALRFTAVDCRRQFVWPARFQSSRLKDPRLPPMGARFRLRADFDLSGFSPHTQVILRALQRYGMMLADNGGAWFLSGDNSLGWRRSPVHRELRRVKGSDFEAVNVLPLQVDEDSGQARPWRRR